MQPNMRSVVAQLFRGGRSIGSRRNFCSPPPDINRKGENLTVLERSGLIPWIMSGSAIYYVWEMYDLMKVRQRMDRDLEAHKLRRAQGQ